MDAADAEAQRAAEDMGLFAVCELGFIAKARRVAKGRGGWGWVILVLDVGRSFGVLLWVI